MAKTCVIQRDENGNVSVLVKNYDNKTHIEKAISRNNNYPLDTAPNGEPSLLYKFYTDELNMSPEEAEYVTANVYSNEFGEWFGRWWEDKDNSSKVVDGNGQPKPVWSGQNEPVDFFKAYTNRNEGNPEVENDGYFSEDKRVAISYALSASIDNISTVKGLERAFEYMGKASNPTILPVFLNIRNVKEVASINNTELTPQIPGALEENFDGFYGKFKSADSNGWVIMDDSQVIPITNDAEFIKENLIRNTPQGTITQEDENGIIDNRPVKEDIVAEDNSFKNFMNKQVPNSENYKIAKELQQMYVLDGAESLDELETKWKASVNEDRYSEWDNLMTEFGYKSLSQIVEENDVLLTKDGLLLNNDSTETDQYYEQLSDIAEKAGMTIAHTTNKNYVIYFDLLTNVVYLNTDQNIEQSDIDGIVNTLKEKYNVDTIEGIDAKIKENRDKFWLKESSEIQIKLPKKEAANKIFEELMNGADYVDATSETGYNIIFQNMKEFSHQDVLDMTGNTLTLNIVRIGAQVTEHNLNTIKDVKPDKPVKHSLTAYTTHSPSAIIEYWNQVWKNNKVLTESASTNIEKFGNDIYVEMSENTPYIGVSPYDNYSEVKTSDNPILQNTKYITRSTIESDPKNVREILKNVKDYEEWLVNIGPANIERMVFKNRSEAEIFGKRMNDDWGIEVAVIDQTVGEIIIKNVETQSKEIFSVINEHLKPTEKFKEYILADVMQDPYEFSYNEMKELSIPELLIELEKKGYSENIIDLVDLSPSFTKVNGIVKIDNDKLLDFIEKSGYFTKKSIDSIIEDSQKKLKDITLSVAKEGNSIVPILKDSDGNDYYMSVINLGEGLKPHLFNDVEVVKTFESEEYDAVKNELREIMNSNANEPKTLFPKKLSSKRLMFSQENSSNVVETPQEILDELSEALMGKGLVSKVHTMTTPELTRVLEELDKEDLKTVPNGFYKSSTREIYLNSEGQNITETMIHEFAHPFLQYLRTNDSARYQAGVEVLENNSDEAAPYIELVQRSQPNLKPGSPEFYEEVLAQIIGDNGAKLVNSTKNNSITQWLKDFWNAVSKIVGITGYSPEQISGMTLKEFSDAMVAELFNEIEAQPTEFIPSRLFEQLSNQPFITQEQALDIYKNIYTDDLNYWKDADLNC